jgi:hypothetical protein
MSKGWESKSVEEQQAQAASATQKTNAAAAHVIDADRKRQRQSLELQRERILSERTSSPHRRTALANALADIEERLAQLGWTIHM